MPEPMVTMRPPSPISCDAARIAVTTPWTLIASWRASAVVSASASSTAALAMTPALLTRISSRPKCFATSFTSWSTSMDDAWSALKARACTPLAFNSLHDGLGLVGGSDVADGDVGAFVGERAGAGGADAARSAGDEGNLACE